MTAASRKNESTAFTFQSQASYKLSTAPRVCIRCDAGGTNVLYIVRRKNGKGLKLIFLTMENPQLSFLMTKKESLFFYSTMIEAFYRSQLPIKHLLVPTDEENIEPNVLQIISNETEKRLIFWDKKSITKLFKREGVKVVSRSVIYENPHIVGNRFVLCIIDPDTTAERFKAKWILQEYQEKKHYNIANSSLILMQMGFCIIISTSSTLFSCELRAKDTEKLYMKSAPLEKNVFTEPP